MNEIINGIREILKTTLGSTYKKYYNAEIRVPNQAFMPFIEVIKNSTSITNRGTGGMQNNEFDIIINVKSSLKKYLNQNTNTEILEYSEDIAEKVEGRDENMNLKSTSILGVLKNNLQLVIDGKRKADIIGDFSVNYDEMDLGESFIVFATIGFKVKIIT